MKTDRAKTTVSIYRDRLATWRRWRQKKKMKNAELMDAIVMAVERRQAAILFASLTPPDNYRRPLTGCHLDKSRISMRISGAP